MSDERREPQSEWMRGVLREHEGPLLRYALRLTGHAETARDCVQETFMRLCSEDVAQLDGHLAQWLFTVCRNRALDTMRKDRRMKSLSPEATATCTSRDPTPSEALERQDTAGNLTALLATLPESQQEVVRLKFQNGLSYREISRITELSVSNVGFLLHTALKTIRTNLNDRPDGAGRS